MRCLYSRISYFQNSAITRLHPDIDHRDVVLAAGSSCALHHETDNPNLIVIVDGHLSDKHRYGWLFQGLSNPIGARRGDADIIRWPKFEILGDQAINLGGIPAIDCISKKPLIASIGLHQAGNQPDGYVCFWSLADISFRNAH
jgi:hypothetical protein